MTVSTYQQAPQWDAEPFIGPPTLREWAVLTNLGATPGPLDKWIATDETEAP